MMDSSSTVFYHYICLNNWFAASYQFGLATTDWGLFPVYSCLYAGSYIVSLWMVMNQSYLNYLWKTMVLQVLQTNLTTLTRKSTPVKTATNLPQSSAVFLGQTWLHQEDKFSRKQLGQRREKIVVIFCPEVNEGQLAQKSLGFVPCNAA